MTTNTERAAEVICEETGNAFLSGPLAHILAAAGLLAPDLPPVAEGACPSCHRRSILVRDLDRWVHLDGSDNQPCWLKISRGETAEEHTDDHA